MGLSANMARKLSEAISLEQLCRHLEDSKRIQGTRVEFVSPWFDDIQEALVATKLFDRNISERDAHALCLEAIFSIPARQTITNYTLSAGIAKALAQFKAKPPEPYVVATSLSLRYTPELKRLRILGATITFSQHLPAQFNRNHIIKARSRPRQVDVRGFATVKIHVKARSAYDAFERASRAIDFVRGCWNFSLNRGIWRQHTDDQTKPLNEILPGPLHTVHHPDGRAATEMFWYEPFFEAPFMTKEPGERWKRVRTDFNNIRRIVHNREGYAPEIQDVCIRYCRALDARDPAKGVSSTVVHS